MHHPVQVRLQASPARHNVNPAGRRSFKTERAKRKLIMGTEHHPGALTMEGGHFFAAAPTRDQAKHIFWNDLKAMTRPFWKGRPSESELVIKLRTDSHLHVIGMDKPERIEGRMWHGGVLDEYANMKAQTWGEHVQPVTADTKAWVDFIGVPDYAGRSSKEYKELFDMAMLRANPRWDAFTWKSSDVMDPDEVEEARRTLSPAAFRQEYEASWETAPGRAYNEFNKGLDAQPLAFLDGEPVHAHCDFNYLHHVWGLNQVGRATPESPVQKYRLYDEIYLRSATVEAMCAALKARLPERYLTTKGLLHFYGDYAGVQHRAEATYTAWQTIKQAFPMADFHYVTNPPISDRVHAVNAVFCNAAGERRVVVSSKCQAHIKDFEYVTLTMLYSASKGGEMTHGSDGFGYFVMQRARIEKSERITGGDMQKLGAMFS